MGNRRPALVLHIPWCFDQLSSKPLVRQEQGDSAIHPIYQLLKRLDTAPVECDGFVRLASTVLAMNDIPHQTIVGQMECNLGRIPLHYWIECSEGVIDFRARMWLGLDAPHGIVEPDLYGAYKGHRVDIDVLDPTVFRILSGLALSEFRKPERRRVAGSNPQSYN